ncbi:putative multidrug resistance protein norM Multidrug-efflux transporter [Proteiniborus sp. DW1]|uniref:MATE family efflux transporter n=1 Tax=Proteiniborus sp. DW1 TaxID=1889883 RepID=UPI00092DF7E9|nr:MATE family efflux transporter [Proteiniborus sp. DW1]SCG82408.1 putative multidrug resistance protein norM Multidrug-efflux transporter [Proteiniborus sp. DW1]
MQLVLKDKKFYKSLANIAIPITLQNLVMSSINMLDTLMITRLGDANIAAAGLANQVFFFFSLILFGVNSGSSIFIAQFWGKKDIKNIRRILGLAIIICGIVSIIFTIGALFIPETLMHIFTHEQDVVELGVKYLKIIGFSYLITSISFAFNTALRSIGQAKIPMFISIVSLLVNATFNYLLIFGKFGFPKMGIEGAALATVLARIVELVSVLYITYHSKNALAAKINELVDVSKDFVVKYFKTAAPVIINEFFWSLGTVMYSVAYARMGKEATSAVQISNTVQNIFLVLSRGLSSACAVMIGNEIGAGNKEKSISYARTFIIIGPLLGIVLGVILFVSTPAIMTLFGNVSAEVYDYTTKMLIVISLSLSIKIVNGLLIVGIFRSGGDTRFSMFLEMGSVWLVGVPLSFLGALVLKIPVYWVVALVTLEEVVKAAIGIPRLLSNKWVRNVVEHM